MLMPKRTKYRRPHRLSYEGRSKAGRTIDFGEYGLVAESGNYVSNRQIEAARIAMTRYMKRGGNVGFVFSLTWRVLKASRGSYGFW